MYIGLLGAILLGVILIGLKMRFIHRGVATWLDAEESVTDREDSNSDKNKIMSRIVRPNLRRGLVVAATLSLLTACNSLNDRPSKRAADEAYRSIRSGMSLREIVLLTEPLVEKSVWGLTIAKCLTTSDSFGIGLSQEDGSYEVETYNAHNGEPVTTNIRSLKTQDLMLQALEEEPLNACGEFRVHFGQWSITFRRDRAGRVTEVFAPEFSD